MENNPNVHSRKKIECDKTTFEGTLFGASESFTITPTYSGCKAMLGLPTDVFIERCHYLFTKPVKIKADQYQTPG